MLIARALAVIAKPALGAGAIAASVGGGWYALDRLTGDSGQTAFQQVQAADQRLLISEFGLEEDAVVAIDPGDPAGGRTEIATIEHAEGWGAFPVLSPQGDAIAYTALPSDTERPAADAPATAGIVEDDGDVVVLATDIDLLIPPVWAPDGQSIVVRKNTPAEDSAGRFELIVLGRDGSRATLTAWNSAAVFPIAFAPDGSALYFATLNASGTDLYSIAPDGTAETLIAHLSDEIARDWKLSPDGARLAYSVAESGPQPSVRTVVLDLESRSAADAVASDDAAREEYNPAWSPGGELTIAAVDGAGGNAVRVEGGVTAQISGEDGSIDLPLAWSPDGAALAVRAVEGESAFDAGASAIDLVQADGTRTRVSDSPDVLIVGWLE